jgi:hypothetical protein
MTGRKKRGVTLAEIKRSWPPAVNVEDSALAFGMSRASAYQAIADGTFPVATIRVNRRIRVLTADLVRVLEGSGQAARSAWTQQRRAPARAPGTLIINHDPPLTRRRSLDIKLHGRRAVRDHPAHRGAPARRVRLRG